MHNEVPRQGRYHILYGVVPWPLLTCQGECETASLGQRGLRTKPADGQFRGAQ